MLLIVLIPSFYIILTYFNIVWRKPSSHSIVISYAICLAGKPPPGFEPVSVARGGGETPFIRMIVSVLNPEVLDFGSPLPPPTVLKHGELTELLTAFVDSKLA